jgi:hypothetical protein
MNLERTTMTQNCSDELVTSNDLIFSKIGCNYGLIGCNFTKHKSKIPKLEAIKI